MINTVYITCTQCKRCNTSRHRFTCHNYYMRKMTFSIPNKTQCFCSTILSPIASHCPFSRY